MIDNVYQLTALAASCKVRGGGSVSERVLFAGRRRLGTSVVCRKKDVRGCVVLFGKARITQPLASRIRSAAAVGSEEEEQSLALTASRITSGERESLRPPP